MAAHRSRGLGQDGLVAGATAAAHSAASAVEHAKLNVVAIGQTVEVFHQGHFGAVELPVAGENTAVLVGVGITQHDVLFGPRALNQIGNARQGVKITHDASRIAQVFNGFKQRHHNQVDLSLRIQCPAHETDFFLQQQNFQ